MGTSIDKRTKWSYCVGATGRDASYVLVSMFVLTYIQYTMKLTVAQFSVITVAMVICMIWDAVNDLMMSTIIENCHFKSGKFRPFILGGALINSVVLVAMFTIRPTGWGFVFFFSLIYLLWGMTYTVNDIAYWGMLPSLTSDPKERDSLVTLMGVFVCIGQFLTAGIVPIVIAGNAVIAFRTIALVIALGLIAFQTLTFWGVTENPRQDNKDKVNLKSMARILFRNDQLIIVGIAYILFCVGQQLLLLLGVNFFYFEFGYSAAGSLITIFTVMYGLGTLAAQFVYPQLSSRISRKRIITVCICALIAGYLLFLSFGYLIPMNVILLNATGLLIFFFQGLFSLAFIVMVNNTIEYDEYRFGERHDSIISAIRSFATKLSGALNQGAASLILIISGIYAVSQNISALEVEVGNGTLDSATALGLADGYIAGVLPSQTLTLRLGMVFVPLVVMIASYLIVSRGYKIDEKEYDRLVAEIEKRK
ncbi:glycoside-pentoside-hexuronide (GPH):cation symporter [Butyrivibrio sp. FCS014]|uniref:glycoside-pentoside-hexuronide (GPH):cation symporter n=1 Tax=Butyrivibrio sp. FCS014 TaxID=1408304 RepID=UPI000467960E|nr:glycoside-pentoside-hexuronide (GPH):cation symporter [Butyrivibrio sp. FCS014]